MSGNKIFRMRGFTLVELMIVVAIIGVLAAVAIPSFSNYQLTSKRAEAFANLASLGKAQKAYYAEFSEFISAEPEPGFTSTTLPTVTKRDSSPIGPAFIDVGWEPEGDVFFDYDTATAADPLNGDCGTCATGCFTSSAYGDLDGNGQFSILILAHPDPTGEYCTTGFAGGGGGYHPPLAPDGSRELDVVARVRDADDF
jgi:prepilin-type N-terminal cleavage/methylation domain-containing protein